MDQGFRPRPRPKTKNREEPLSEETLHKTKLTDDVGPKKKSHIKSSNSNVDCFAFQNAMFSHIFWVMK